MAGDPLKKGRYTNFGNKIGLFSNKTGNFICNSPEVVLNFPFKDTVLEAGMTKEDSSREERFLHIEMDAKDIDTLEDPKVLTNFKYIDQSGEHALDENSNIEFFDENGELKQNLLIKGNNLLALHTLKEKLKEKLTGKIKLIYIDPPYNTKNDGFRYNDSFNHSSWLTFMRNRLEIAKELLALNGSIYVNIDYNEVHYLKVLMDEIFGINNFQREIIWRMGFLSGYKTSANNYIRNHDTILFYTKSSENMFFNKVYLQNNDFAPILKDSKDLRKYLINQGMTEQKINDFLQYINHTSRGKHYPLEDTWNCNKWDELNSMRRIWRVRICSFSATMTCFSGSTCAAAARSFSLNARSAVFNISLTAPMSTFSSFSAVALKPSPLLRSSSDAASRFTAWSEIRSKSPIIFNNSVASSLSASLSCWALRRTRYVPSSSS